MPRNLSPLTGLDFKNEVCPGRRPGLHAAAATRLNKDAPLARHLLKCDMTHSNVLDRSGHRPRLQFKPTTYAKVSPREGSGGFFLQHSLQLLAQFGRILVTVLLHGMANRHV